jgi:hypothetical protein
MFSYISVIISFFKSKGSLILNYFIGFIIISLLIANIVLSKKLETCKTEKNSIEQTLKHNAELQQLKDSYANKTIQQNNIQYKERIVYIQKEKANETKDNCTNAINLLRSYF